MHIRLIQRSAKLYTVKFGVMGSNPIPFAVHLEVMR